MSSTVLDSSALLALLNKEVGGDIVAQHLAAGAVISTVNLAEVVARLREAGRPLPAIMRAISQSQVQVVDFDRALAYRTGDLRLSTRYLGLSLGDRACLASAEQLSGTAVTADRAWGNLAVGITIELIR